VTDCGALTTQGAVVEGVAAPARIAEQVPDLVEVIGGLVEMAIPNKPNTPTCCRWISTRTDASTTSSRTRRVGSTRSPSKRSCVCHAPGARTCRT
jgi:hypothetical protein